MPDRIETILAWLGAGSIDIFGSPFSGKDTQANKLAELFNGEVVAGGDIVRSHDDPEKIKEVMAEGGIIPSDFYLNLVLPYLSRGQYNNKPLILSAVGRSSGEEPSVIKAANDSGHPLKAVIYLKLTEDEVWRRFNASQASHDRGNRADDQADAIKTRLKKFKERTIPVIDHYRNSKLLIEVDGSLERDEVTNEIIEGLCRYIKS
jgi:adenylate kinase